MWPPDSEKPVIRYSEGDTVLLTVGESGADFYDLTSSSFRESKDYYHLVPELPNSATRIPAMSLQVTLFQDVGFCVGYAIHHAVADGKSIAMFMHSWAFLCRSGAEDSGALIPELTPFYDRSVIRDSYDLERHYMDLWLGFDDGSNKKTLSMLEMSPADDTMLGSLELSKKDIDNLTKSVFAQWQEKDIHNHRTIHVSSYTVTIAYILICLVRTRRKMASFESVDLNEEHHFALSVDCRTRMEPGVVPSNYFGNCVTAIAIDMTLSDMFSENGVAIAVEKIGEAIERLKDGVLKDKEDMLAKFYSYPPGSVTTVAGSTRFEHYKTDFGWGNPRRVKLISIDKNGAFTASDSQNGDGVVEIGLVLKKHEIEDFVSLFLRVRGLEPLSMQ